MKIIQKIKCKLGKHNFDAPYILQALAEFSEVYQKCLSCSRGRHFRIIRQKKFTQLEMGDLFAWNWRWNPMYDNNPDMKDFLDHYKKLDLI